MLTLLFIVAVSTAAVCARSLSNNLVVTRQDSANAGQIQQVDVTTGSVLAVADPSFVFSFPHVEVVYVFMAYSSLLFLILPPVERAYCGREIGNSFCGKALWIETHLAHS